MFPRILHAHLMFLEIMPDSEPIYHSTVIEPLVVTISREIPLPWFELKLANNMSEELGPDEAREFFRVRGADMDVVEKALDYVWNFGTYKPVQVIIRSPKKPPTLDPRVAPKL